jgi:hypothetical protein
MEPEVHIIDKYFQEMMHCLTMTNTKCKGGKEIDLLAINPKTLEKYHVEATIRTKSKIVSEEGLFYYWKNNPAKKGLNYFHRYKFEDEKVKQKIEEIFGKANYHKVLLVWGIKNDTVAREAKEKYGIEIMSLRHVIHEFMDNKITSGSRDDILRTMELVSIIDSNRRKYQRKLKLQREKS